MWKWPVVKEKHSKMQPRIYVLFVFHLDGECKFIKNRAISLLEICSIGCRLFSVNRISLYHRTKVAAKDSTLTSIFPFSFVLWGFQKSAVIAIHVLETPAGSIS